MICTSAHIGKTLARALPADFGNQGSNTTVVPLFTASSKAKCGTKMYVAYSCELDCNKLCALHDLTGDEQNGLRAKWLGRGPLFAESAKSRTK